jgi:hypothetical protein
MDAYPPKEGLLWRGSFDIGYDLSLMAAPKETRRFSHSGSSCEKDVRQQRIRIPKILVRVHCSLMHTSKTSLNRFVRKCTEGRTRIDGCSARRTEPGLSCDS